MYTKCMLKILNKGKFGDKTWFYIERQNSYGKIIGVCKALHGSNHKQDLCCDELF